MSSKKSSTPNKDDPVLYIGVYYQRSKDPLDLVYTYGVQNGQIMYYDNKNVYGSIPQQQVVSDWIPKKQVKDFPASENPRLPYSYDLLWDVKRLDQIRNEQGEKREALIKQLRQDYGHLDWKKAVPWDTLKKHLALQNDIESGFIPEPDSLKMRP